MAIAPLSVNTTTAMRNDPAQVLLVCAAIHAALVASTTDRRLWPVLAGVFGGAATAVGPRASSPWCPRCWLR